MLKLKFEELSLSKEIQKAIEDLGYEEATAIQSSTIPLLLEGRDVIGQSQTGSGKTAAFGIPLLEKIQSGSKEPQGLILCPTRELAIQVAEEFKKLGKYKKGIFSLPVYGGQSIERQITALKRGVQIIIGTPGRILDHLERKTLKLSKVHTLVLDEADRMLDMGFIEDVEEILAQMDNQPQTVLFSATMPEPIIALTKKYQNNPEFVKVVHQELTVPTIEQIYYEVRESMKLEALSRLLDMNDFSLSMVFCNTKRMVDEVVSHLQIRGYSAEGLHGDMKQMQRDRVMDKFKKGTVEILVATDVAARGLDITGVEAVFNYDLPQDEDSYVHRIGRTGRAGKSGKSFTFVVGKEFYRLRDIQRYAKIKIPRGSLPTLGEVREAQYQEFLDDIRATVDEGGLERYALLVDQLIQEDYSALEIASALVKMGLPDEKDNHVPEDLNEVFHPYENKQRGHRRKDFPQKHEIKSHHGKVHLFINAGRQQGITPRDLVGAIAGESGIPGKVIGDIRILESFSFVDVPEKFAIKVLDSMQHAEIRGKKINVEVAKEKPRF